MNIREKTSSGFNSLLSILMGIQIVILAAILIIVCLSIFMRYFFSTPIGWALEIVEYGLLWAGFIAAATLLRDETHTKMDLLLNSLRPKTGALVNMVISVFGTVLCLVITRYTSEKTWELFMKKTEIISMLGPPKYIVVIIIPVSFFLLSLQYIRRSYKFYLQWRDLTLKHRQADQGGG